MTSKSTASSKRGEVQRPPKPYAAFPLFAHATGRWAKKIRGRLIYFGRWAGCKNGKLVPIAGGGWEGALEAYQDQADDLHAGRTPRVKSDGLTVAELCNRFLAAKQRQCDAGEIVLRTFADYRLVTDRLVRVFGKGRLVDDLAADDFEALREDTSKTRGLVCLANDITRTRVVFKWAYDAGLIEKPIRYGPSFRRLKASAIRRQRQGNGPRMFETDEARKIIDAAKQPMKAMFLLAMNCALGNADLANMEMRHVDFSKGWLTYPRQKTAVARRAKLWPETIQAVRDAINARPKPKHEDDSELVFLTCHGNRWDRNLNDKPSTKEFRKLLDRLGLYREGLGLYAARHTFRTVADASRDYPAVNLVMGHTDSTMSGVYRERIDDARLEVVSEQV